MIHSDALVLRSSVRGQMTLSNWIKMIGVQTQNIRLSALRVSILCVADGFPI